MLCEIYCEQFHQKRITFHDGLNVVLGTSKADNSIGKTTLMLIVDFAFGGNAYTDATDILANVGEHIIGFKFCFNDKEYFYSRSITDRNTVWECDSSYTQIKSISTADYCNILSQLYGVNMYKLTFRDVVGRYIRVYGKENYDEKHPLHATPKESGEKATTALLKLFDGYRVIDGLDARAKESAINLNTYSEAQRRNLIAKITKTQYSKNEKDIAHKTKEIEQLSTQLDKGLLDLDAVASEQAIEIKRKLGHAKRMRSKLLSRLSVLDENSSYKFSDTTDTFSELARFFPNIDLQHIDEIERFHDKIVLVFKSELQNEKKNIDKQLVQLSSIISNLEKQLEDLVGNPNLSKVILKKHADTVREIERMERENEVYQKTQELKRIKTEDEESLRHAKSEQFGEIEKAINTEMDRINNLLYVEQYNPPIIHFTETNYNFRTPDDTGTGIAYKGLVVFDLAMMHLTRLPILVHDSLILKQISDEAIETILQQYSACGKQVIIALDKQDSYSDQAFETLVSHTVIKLAPGGEELFGRSWSKHSRDNE